MIVVATLGLIAGSAGAIAAISMADLGPDWYSIALALTDSRAYGSAGASQGPARQEE